MKCVSADFHFVLNGESVRVTDVAPQITLLEYIRSRGLTGAKEGCAEGECGACAVLFAKDSVRGAVYESINSCLVPVAAAAGQEVSTVESLAEGGELAEVQRAMMSGGGSQCGYCTPGFVVSMFALQYRKDGSPADLLSLGGNLCRCTGYRPIRDALQSLGPPPRGRFLRRLERPAPPIEPVCYANLEGRFSRPCDLDECFELMEGDEFAQFVAGNTDLGVLTNLRDRRFPHLISLEGISELREFRDGSEYVEIGAGLTLTEIGERWTDAPRIFKEWFRLFASPLIRNRATLGGNLATASPIGDAAPMLLALDSEVLIAGPAGERLVPLNEFFTGYRRTLLGRSEILRSVRIPKPLPTRARFYKVAKRSLDDISTVAAGMAIIGDEMRFGFGGVAPVPIRISAKLGRDIDLRDYVKPISDHRGSAEYRLAVAQSLIEKFQYDCA